MATKDKDGNWIFTEQEEGEINMAAEARVRAAKRLRADNEVEEKRIADKKSKEVWDKTTERRATERRIASKDSKPKDRTKKLSW